MSEEIKTMNRIQRISNARIRLLLMAVSLMAGFAVTGLGEAQGTVIKKRGTGQASGMIKWMPASRKYVVTDAQGVSIQIPLSDVETVKVKDPPELESAAKLVQGGQAALAIPNLEKIVKDFEMMGPDARAARWLAEAYQKTGVPGKAVEMCERVVASNPNAAGNPEFAAIYWEALMGADLTAKLKKALGEAIAQGPRPLVAQALIKRGDIEKKQGNFKEALIDGYLRVIVLFQDIKEAQPEALYNATKCFEQLNQGPYAERMRKKLLAEFPDDPYSEKIKSGS
jgi:tetratricopeptide (TPR) repeat protein